MTVPSPRRRNWVLARGALWAPQAPFGNGGEQDLTASDGVGAVSVRMNRSDPVPHGDVECNWVREAEERLTSSSAPYGSIPWCLSLGQVGTPRRSGQFEP